MWEYKGQTFKNQKELKDKCGFSGSVFRAKVKDGEIVRINTGLKPYEEIYNYSKRHLQ